jgi:hypothetical protein
MNAVRRRHRCYRSLIAERPENRGFVESGQQALTVALEGAVTMRRGRAMPLPGRPGVMHGNAADDRPAAEVAYPRSCCVGLALRERRAPDRRHCPVRSQAVTAASGMRWISGEAARRDGGSCFTDPACAADPPIASRAGRCEIHPDPGGRCSGENWERSTGENGTARRRRELRGLEFHQRCALTTRCEFPHLVPKSACYGRSNLRWRQSALAPGSFKPQSRRRPPSPTPASPPTASL